MASAAPASLISRLRSRPLGGGELLGLGLAVWVAGAVYCSGYERLMSGLDNWPGSLWWSAVAVLPWLALFEWSKSKAGRRIAARPASLAGLLAVTAAVSLALEGAGDALLGSEGAPLALSLMRRLPAIGAGLLLILWARSEVSTPDEANESLVSLGNAIDWVAAADNYVELHMGNRIVMRRTTLNEAERALAGLGFVRIHRRYLVNRRRVTAVSGNGDRMVRLTDGAELPVGRRYAANLGSLDAPLATSPQKD